ncbi:MAG: acyl-CoA dehydrogenase [Sphingopyxis macrogoltabida]|uniref:Acyl-CoA dehydrogenase n=1 Tax=Sphingopyxis macrogoltabida TaxID=33050 RepID=A0A2W5L014_SPHMC|nr:MAG: acyl-CoA dehydrogenase [Sphingopyxis macrogoltabida]
MEFGLSDDQKLLVDTLSRALADTVSVDTIRGSDPAHVRDDPLWRQIVEFGVPSLLVPEQFGGLGLSLLDAALVSECLGAAAAPVPHIGASVLAPLALTLAGSAAQQAKWLPRIASGNVAFGVAISEHAAGVRGDAGVVRTAERLTGIARFALDAAGADAFIVADLEGGLHLVAADAPGVTIEPVATIDRTRGIAHLKLDNVAGEPLGEGVAGHALRRMIEAGRIMLAADTLGAASVMIDKAVAYSLERKQFDRIVGSFQAVKHLSAEMVAELEPCRSLIWYAAHSFDALPDECAVMSAHAKSLTDEAGRFVARTATEVHGGIGFTDLLGLHFWFKRIGLNRQLLGGPEYVRQEIAGLLGWGTSRGASACSALDRMPDYVAIERSTAFGRLTP